MDCKNCNNNNPSKNKSTKIVGIFLSLLFATTLFSAPTITGTMFSASSTIVGTVYAQSDTGSENACKQGGTLERGQCTIVTEPKLKCPTGSEGPYKDPKTGEIYCIKKDTKPPSCEKLPGAYQTIEEGDKCKGIFKDKNVGKAACAKVYGYFDERTLTCYYHKSCPKDYKFDPIKKVCVKIIKVPPISYCDPPAKLENGKCVFTYKPGSNQGESPPGQ